MRRTTNSRPTLRANLKIPHQPPNPNSNPNPNPNSNPNPNPNPTPDPNQANTKSGVTLRNGCDAVRIARNRIRDGRDAGVHALQGAFAEVLGNDIFGNAQACTSTDAHPPHA